MNMPAMARPWTWTISDTDGSNRRTMTLGQYLAEAKVAAEARGSTAPVHPRGPRTLPRSRALARHETECAHARGDRGRTRSPRLHRDRRLWAGIPKLLDWSSSAAMPVSSSVRDEPVKILERRPE